MIPSWLLWVCVSLVLAAGAGVVVAAVVVWPGAHDAGPREGGEVGHSSRMPMRDG